MSTTPLLFVNVGWQIRYQGPAKDDPTLGGHGYLRKHAMGHEAWNFSHTRGKVYGYIPRETTVKIERLGASPRDAVMNGVTVVWLARHPSTGRTVIVGWYINATVHRTAGEISMTRKEGIRVTPQIVADAQGAQLLPIDQRTFPIPTKKEPGCLGQSPVWYGTDDAFRDRVHTFIARGGRHAASGARRRAGAGWQNDAASRKRIEEAAVDFATRYYESVEGGERDVDTVEHLARGWDLEAVGAEDCLKVEVKGVSGDVCSVELTPNEYEAMLSSEHRPHYVVFVVTGLEAKRPLAHIFRYDGEASSRGRPVWISQRGHHLRIEERIAARLSLVRARN